MAIRFTHSAARHGIATARAAFVVEHCRWPLYSSDPDVADHVVFLGPDAHGVPLGVVAIDLDDGTLLVIHAMRLRATYRDAYEEGDAMARTVKTKSGRTLSEADVERLADDAEIGFDLAAWKPRRGRPTLGPSPDRHSPRIAVRVSTDVHRRIRARANTEGRTISEVVRDLLEAYAGDVVAPKP